MRLLFVTDNGFSENDGNFYFGGGNLNHYKYLIRHFDEIMFIARKNIYNENFGIMIDKKHDVFLFEKSFNGLINMTKKIKSIISECDAVACFNINGCIAQKIAKKYTKTSIVFVGACAYESQRAKGTLKGKIFARPLLYLFKTEIWNADFVHYVDKWLLEKYPTKGEKLICTDAFIPIDNLALLKRRKKISKLNSKIVIGIIGSAVKIKGVDTAIKALSFLDDKYSLHVVGGGDSNWLEQVAEEFGVSKKFYFKGRLKGGKEILEWLDTIDVYMQPSITEGLPRATLEAMSRACPVVSTKAGGLSSIVNDKYIVEIGDYRALAKAVLEICKSTDEMQRQAEYSFMKELEFSTDIIDEKIDGFYKKVQAKIL